MFDFAVGDIITFEVKRTNTITGNPIVTFVQSIIIELDPDGGFYTRKKGYFYLDGHVIKYDKPAKPRLALYNNYIGVLKYHEIKLIRADLRLDVHINPSLKINLPVSNYSFVLDYSRRGQQHVYK